MTATDRREKLLSAAATAAVLALLGTALLRGLGVQPGARIEEALALVTLPVAAPPPRHQTKPRRPAPAPRAAAPPAPHSQAAPIVAPPPPLPVVAPPPVAVARTAGIGAAAFAGAADAGTGQGAGGRGSGPGAGGDDGDGGLPPRQTGGRLHYGDLPANRRALGISATVGVRYSVETDGRVGPCVVTRASGYPDVDATTCRLIAERFRFQPARDPDGRRVQSWIVESHSFLLDRRSGGDSADDEDGPPER